MLGTWYQGEEMCRIINIAGRGEECIEYSRLCMMYGPPILSKLVGGDYMASTRAHQVQVV